MMLIIVFAWLMLVFQVTYEATNYLHPTYFLFGHLAFVFIIVGTDLVIKARSRLTRSLWILGQVTALAVIAYLAYNWDTLQFRVGHPGNFETFVGVLFIVVILAFSWRQWGAVFPVFALICIAYAFWGDNPIFGPLKHTGGGWKSFISYMALGEDGIMSSLLMLGAGTIWIYIVFGNLLETVRATPFFIEIGKAIGKYVKGGAAFIAVVASGLVGMCTGASVANVTITGTFTIPLMKKTGIKPGIAGAVECLASNGGQFVPPVLGAAAFLMVSLAGYSYKEICISSIGVTVLYYLFLSLALLLTASRDNWPSIAPKFDRDSLIYGGMAFVVPIALLCFFLYQEVTPARCGYIAFTALVVMGFVFKYNRPSPSKLITGMAGAIKSAAALTLVVACLGIPVVILRMTGAVLLLGYFVEAVSGGSILVALIMSHLVLLILGCGLPTVAAYAVGALICVPILIRMGVDPFSAHYFAFYNAVFASVTPPIALTAVPAAALAKTSFGSVVMESLKLAGPTYFVPYIFVYFPFILAHPVSTYNTILGIIVTMSLVTVSIALVRYAKTRLSLWETLAYYGVSIVMLGAGISNNMALAIAMLVTTAALITYNFIKARRLGPVEAIARVTTDEFLGETTGEGAGKEFMET